MHTFSRLPRRGRLAIASGLIALATTVGLVSTATPAHATGGDCVTYNSGADGIWCFTVKGNGNYVSSVTGHDATAWIDNSYMVVRFYDIYGNNYATYFGPVHVGRAYGVVYWDMGNVNGNFRPGEACGALRSGGSVFAVACTGIY